MDVDEKEGKRRTLYDRIRNDPDYRTGSMGTIFVPGTGAFQAKPLVFIGEAPGRDEERAEQPFVGAAGRNLNTLLEEVGISRNDVFITNLIKYRPMTPRGENRSPTTRESRYALPYLIQELRILIPRAIVCLGLSSAKALLEDSDLRMGAANGVFFEAHGYRILVTYHPSPYNYKIPEKREAMRRAFQLLREI